MNKQSKILLGLVLAIFALSGWYFGLHSKKSAFLGATQTYPIHLIQNPTSFDQLFAWGGMENAGTLWQTGPLNASSTLTAATTTISGHLITLGSAPTVAAGGSGFSAGTVISGSTDVDGQVSSTVATANGGVVTINFATAFATAPYCVFANASVATDTYYVTSTVGAVSLNLPAGLIAGAHSWNYQCNQ